MKEAVGAYIAEYREAAAQEMEFFRRCEDLSRVIHFAALSKLPSGKRHPHQCRIPEAVLQQAERDLQAVAPELERTRSFSEVFEIVKREIGPIHGIGELAIYDIGSRIGTALGLEPEHVYVHAGTREGLRALGLNHRRRTIGVSELPRPFHRLRPREIEDCLCIYKSQLARCR